jgi:hypothetical protein
MVPSSGLSGPMTAVVVVVVVPRRRVVVLMVFETGLTALLSGLLSAPTAPVTMAGGLVNDWIAVGIVPFS